jgi:prepilin-type N-terminal cleavage/methylation domain-containing protein
VINPCQVQREENGPHDYRSNHEKGFTLIELIFVLLIAVIMTVMAIPLVNTTLTNYRIHGAASAVSSSLQSTRYLAIFNGYPFQVVYNSAALTYQVKSDPARSGTFTNYCVPAAASCPVPLAGSGLNVVLNADTTFTFSPGGTTQSTTAAAGVTTMVITYSGKTETITVSSYGNVKVTP